MPRQPLLGILPILLTPTSIPVDTFFVNCSGLPQDAESLRIVLDAMPVAVSWARLTDLKIVFMNRLFTQTFGFVPEDFRDVHDWIERQYPFEEDRAAAAEKWGAFFKGTTEGHAAIEPTEIRVRCKDGSVKTVINSGAILPDSGWALATFVDITGRKRDEVFLREAARQARENQAIYKTLLDHSPEMIILSPFDRTRRYVSPAVLHITGFTQEEYLALDSGQLSHPDDRTANRAVIDALRNGSLAQCIRYRALQKDGSHRWVQATVSAYLDPESRRTAGYVATIRDISGEIEAERSRSAENLRLTTAAARDELTGIANRRAFNQALAREASRLAHTQDALSLLIIDVDHFKLYNDHWGHLEGDACLWTVAQALEGAVARSSDLVARFGGEEFVVLAPGTGAAGVSTVAQRILEAVASLELPHPVAKRHIVTVSIGGTTVPAGVRLDEAKLIAHADRALYIAKAEGRNAFRFLAYDPDLVI